MEQILLVYRLLERGVKYSEIIVLVMPRITCLIIG